MNVDNVRKLIEHLEGEAKIPGVIDRFDLGVYVGDSWASGTHCETVGCIAGHAIALLDPDQFNNDGDCGVFSEAMGLLGLTCKDAVALFEPDSGRVHYDRVTAQVAAKVLRHLLDTGEVDWSVVPEVFYGPNP